MSAEQRLTVREVLALRGAHLVTGLFLSLGLLAMLRTGLSETRGLIIFQATPALAWLWLAIGAAGAGMVTGPARARLYLTICAAALLAWCAAAAARADGGGLLVDDGAVMALHLLTGLLSLGLAVFAALTPPTRSSDDAPEQTP